MRFCKDCGIKVGKRKSYCSPCLKNLPRNKIRGYYQKEKLGTLICGYEGCKEPRGFGIHSCEYHSKENRDKRYMEEIVSCKDCGCDLGKRKNHKYQKYCNNCSEIRKKNSRKKQIKYFVKWFKNKYHTDEGFRKRNLEYQSNYKKKIRMSNRQKHIEWRRNTLIETYENVYDNYEEFVEVWDMEKKEWKELKQ